MISYHTKIYGHRGASEYAPENTMDAFQMAYDMGADGIELDVQLTKDEQVVVIHDEWLDRVSDGCGMVKDYTLEGLRSFNFNQSHSSFGTVKIPLLTDVLEAFRNSELLLNIELKNTVVPYKGMEAHVLRYIKEFDFMERTIFSSFSHKSMIQIRALEKQAKIAFLFGDGILDVSGYLERNQVMRGNLASYLCDQSLIEEFHKREQEINIWTVNSGSEIRKFCNMGVDGIITNKPDLGVEIKWDYKKE